MAGIQIERVTKRFGAVVTLDDATRVRVQAPAGSRFEMGQRVGVVFESGASTVFGA